MKYDIKRGREIMAKRAGPPGESLIGTVSYVPHGRDEVVMELHFSDGTAEYANSDDETAFCHAWNSHAEMCDEIERLRSKVAEQADMLRIRTEALDKQIELTTEQAERIHTQKAMINSYDEHLTGAAESLKRNSEYQVEQAKQAYDLREKIAVLEQELKEAWREAAIWRGRCG